ncbi:MAG: AmmeMemoRadiSam system protein A [Candidatus Nanohaloarchaeota archaeon QJJ-9]|nr:AmmeMemoRadiSam system protein A [Candidatus Nanohaloarchaeota archaeon QJJ-9]
MLDREEGNFLVKLARESVESYLKEGERPETNDLPYPELKENRGCFVTIKNNGDLKGCIGEPIPKKKLFKSVKDCAIKSATGDPRFPSLRQNELDDIVFEVSVLTKPKEIEEKPDRILDKVKVGRDGLIVDKGYSSGLLLPQVPLEQDWTTRDFLRHTCRKARLPQNAWRDEETTIKKFRAQVFREEEPGGDVSEVEIDS